jgi:hypothetical protein
VVALPIAWRSGRPADPAVDIAGVLTAAAAPGRTTYRSGAASLFLNGGRGWTLSVYTGAAARFEADFVVVRRFDGVLTVDLLLDPRAAGHVSAEEFTGMPELRLAGPEAVAYLARVGIAPASFDAVAGRSDVARAGTAATTSAASPR